jgi:hypothetical protein
MHEGSDVAGSSESSAILVVFARHPRSAKVQELTSQWSDSDWSALAEGLKRAPAVYSDLPNSRIFILPDLECLPDLDKVLVHRLVRQLFVERRRLSFSSPLVILSCFEKDGPADLLLKRSFSVFISLHQDEGKMLLLYVSDLESQVQSTREPVKVEE